MCKQHSGLFNVLYGVQICHRKGTKGLSLGQYPQKDKFAPFSKGTLWYHSTIRYNLVRRGTYLPLKIQICTHVKGYNGCALEGTAPVTSQCTPEGTNLANKILTVQ